MSPINSINLLMNDPISSCRYKPFITISTSSTPFKFPYLHPASHIPHPTERHLYRSPTRNRPHFLSSSNSTESSQHRISQSINISPLTSFEPHNTLTSSILTTLPFNSAHPRRKLSRDQVFRHSLGPRGKERRRMKTESRLNLEQD